MRIAEPCIGIGNSKDACAILGRFSTRCGPMWDLLTGVKPALLALVL